MFFSYVDEFSSCDTDFGIWYASVEGRQLHQLQLYCIETTRSSLLANEWTCWCMDGVDLVDYAASHFAENCRSTKFLLYNRMLQP